MVHVSHQVRLKNCLEPIQHAELRFLFIGKKKLQTHSQYADAMDINSETFRWKSKIQEVKKDLQKSLDFAVKRFEESKHINHIDIFFPGMGIW